MEYPCVACAREVRPRQHAVACDMCEGWQHRTCGTGISVREYKAAVRGNKDIPFVCCQCKRKGEEPSQSKEDSKSTPSKTDASPKVIACRTPERDLPTSVEDILQDLEPLPTPEPVIASPAQKSPASPVTTVNRALFISPEPDLRYNTDNVNLNTTRVIQAYSLLDSAEDPCSSTDKDRTDVQQKSSLPYLGLSFNLESDEDSPTKPDLNRAFFNCSGVTDLADQNKAKNEPVSYRVIKQGSLMGKDLLTDSIGYTYVIKSQSCRRTRWRCSVRTQYWTCRANVVQTDTTFTAGDEIHMHFPQIHKSKDAELIVKIRDKVENRLSTAKKSARTIVQETMEETGRETPLSERKIQTLMRRTNNIRAKHKKNEAYKENEKNNQFTRPLTLPEPQKRSQPAVQYTSGTSTVAKTTLPAPQLTNSTIQTATRTTLSAPPSTVHSTVQSTNSIHSVARTTMSTVQSTVQSTNSIIHSVASTTLPAPQKRPPSTVQSTVQPTNSIIHSVARTTLPAPQKRLQAVVHSSNRSLFTATGTFLPKLQKRLPSTIQPTNSSKRTVTGTTLPVPQQRPQPTCVQNNDTKKRKMFDSPSVNERYHQLLKRPRYERTARSIVEDSIRNQGYDPANPPPFLNVDNLIRVVNRCRRKNLISECERLMSERLGDVNKTLRPPTEIQMEADSDCLQGKEEERYF